MDSKIIGILGGGQLGKMTAEAARQMGHKVVIFCDQENSIASKSAESCIVASYDDFEALKKFSEICDVITFEFENIPVATVEFLEKIVPVFASSRVLKITQNRLLEKKFFNDIGVSTADFAEIKTNQDLLQKRREFGKAILKTATLGYDGKGQFVIDDEKSALAAWDEILLNNLTKNGLILEKFCPFESEISVIVTKSTSGEIACYEPLTNIHKNGILDKSFYPAKISQQCAKNAKEMAIKIAREIELTGILAIEFFVMADGNLLANEMAPRPHNSGHFSMDGCLTSQFEQTILAITGAKLGDVKYHSNGFMQNLIGDDVNDLAEFEENGRAKIHLYGKKEVLAGRKMGHVNIVERN